MKLRHLTGLALFGLTCAASAFADTTLDQPNIGGFAFLANSAEELYAASYPEHAGEAKQRRQDRATLICKYFNLTSAVFAGVARAPVNNGEPASLVDILPMKENGPAETNEYYLMGQYSPTVFRSLICK